jgi:hypothetical protein
VAKQLLIIALAIAVIFTTEPRGVGAAADDKKAAREQPLEEVFQTDLVYPQDKGEVQVTFAPRFQRGGKFHRLILPLKIEYGITDAWQVELGWESLQQHHPDEGASTVGLGDLRIGTKYSFMNMANTHVHTAVGFDLLVPVGNINRGLTEGLLEYEPFVILAQDFPALHNLQLFTQVGVGLVQRVKQADNPAERESAAHESTLNVGFFLPFDLPVGTFIFTSEFNWRTNRWNNDGQEDQKYYTPGLVWHLPGGWELGIGAAIGLNHDADKYRIISTLTFEFDTQKCQVKEVTKR